MKNIHIALLGLKVKDAVTGFTGVVTTISFDLYGCIQAVVTPPFVDSDKPNSGKWFDVSRLEILDGTPVMDHPDFEAGYVAEGKKGAAEKSLP
jgi:hypothetical protein